MFFILLSETFLPWWLTQLGAVYLCNEINIPNSLGMVDSYFPSSLEFKCETVNERRAVDRQYGSKKAKHICRNCRITCFTGDRYHLISMIMQAMKFFCWCIELWKSSAIDYVAYVKDVFFHVCSSSLPGIMNIPFLLVVFEHQVFRRRNRWLFLFLKDTHSLRWTVLFIAQMTKQKRSSQTRPLVQMWTMLRDINQGAVLTYFKN